MQNFALIPERLFDGDHFYTDQAVLIEQGTIEQVVDKNSLSADYLHLDVPGLLAPGFIDIQVNGGGGVLFNTATNCEGIAAIAAAHRRYGTTNMLPTLMSDRSEVISAGILAIEQSIENGIPGILGVHLEGPYLNPARRGIHNALYVRELDNDAVELLSSCRQGRTLVTLAPEMVPAGTIRKLRRRNVLVAAGHSAARWQQIQSAIDEGLCGFTHLFNAMSPLTGREPGVLGAALESSGLGCGIIVDGHHVHPSNLKIALAAKRPGEIFLVSDAMPPVGTQMTRFELNGELIYSHDGRCTNADNVLAGSSLDMATAVRNCIHLLDLDPAEALRMASRYPAGFLQIDDCYGSIRAGYRACLVALDDQFMVRATWVDGQRENHQLV